MFDTIKNIIDRRLGKLIVLDDLSLMSGYYIKIAAQHLQTAIFFLKNDPDARLTLLDQIAVIPTGCLPWNTGSKLSQLEVLYQLKSLKLPYRISLVVEIADLPSSIPSISSLFLGAYWQEIDIQKKYGIDFENND